jgi:hypothetical protein
VLSANPNLLLPSKCCNAAKFYDDTDSMALTNSYRAAQFLKHNVHWELLRPGEPITFLLKADGWVRLYGDNSAIVLAKAP